MSRRYPRLSECRNPNDFVRGQFYQDGNPTADTGFRQYGTGRRILTAADGANDVGVVSALTYPLPALGATKLVTMAFRCVPSWAGNAGVGRGFLSMSSSGPAMHFTASNKFGLYMGTTGKVSGALQSFAAGTTHYVIGRFSDSFCDETYDGANTVQVANSALPASTSLAVGTYLAAGDLSGYIGPIIWSPAWKSDLWRATLAADTAAWSDPARLMRDYLDPGDIFIPLDGDSRYYIRTIGSGLPFDTVDIYGPEWTSATQYFRDVVKVGSTYYGFEEGVPSANHWSVNVRSSADGTTWGAPSAALLAEGAESSYDYYGQADPTVVYDGAGDWKMWHDAYDGAAWRGIGYATSADGATWSKVGEVLSLGDAGAWDDNYIHHPCVINNDGTYYMFYAGGKAGVGTVDIGLATSEDGETWTKYGTDPVIPAGTGTDFDIGTVRPASPFLVGSTWVMLYWAKADGATTFQHRIGVATSPDLLTWTKKGPLWEPVGDLKRNLRAGAVGPGPASTISEGGVYRTWFGGSGDALMSNGTVYSPIREAYLRRFLT